MNAAAALPVPKKEIPAPYDVGIQCTARSVRLYSRLRRGLGGDLSGRLGGGFLRGRGGLGGSRCLRGRGLLGGGGGLLRHAGHGAGGQRQRRQRGHQHQYKQLLMVNQLHLLVQQFHSGPLYSYTT